MLKYAEIERSFKEVSNVSRVEFVADEIWVVLPIDELDDALVNCLRDVEEKLRAADSDLPRVVYINRRGSLRGRLTL